MRHNYSNKGSAIVTVSRFINFISTQTLLCLYHWHVVLFVCLCMWHFKQDDKQVYDMENNPNNKGNFIVAHTWLFVSIAVYVVFISLLWNESQLQQETSIVTVAFHHHTYVNLFVFVTPCLHPRQSAWCVCSACVSVGRFPGRRLRGPRGTSLCLPTPPETFWMREYMAVSRPSSRGADVW